MNNDIRVVAATSPFSNKQVVSHVGIGTSIQDIVSQHLPQRYVDAGVGARVWIDGNEIYPQYWRNVKPVLGTLVNVRVVPMGGGGGGKKNPLKTVLSIAVMIAAPYVGGALAAATGGWIGSTFYGVSALSTAFTAAAGAVGRLLVSALAPPPKPSKMGGGGLSISNPAESPTQFIEGAKNAINLYGVVPMNLGTNRVFPLQAALPYTETQDNDQYVRQLLTTGFGDEQVISSIQIGETSIANFDGVEMQHRLNGDLHISTSLYSNDVYTDDYSVLLREEDGFTVRTTKPGANEAIVDFTWPRGCCYYNAEGVRLGLPVQLEIQYSPKGLNNWSPGISGFKTFAGSSVSVPDVPVSFANGQASVTASRTDTVVMDAYSGVVTLVQGQDGFNGPQPVPANSLRLASVLTTTTGNQVTGAFTTNIVVTDIRQSTLAGIQLSSPSDFAPSNTGNTVNVAGGSIQINNFEFVGNQTETLRKSARIVFPSPGEYDIRARMVTVYQESDQVFSDCYLTAIKSIRYVAPVMLEGINGTAIRIKGTDQLNGAIDQLNYIVSTLVPDYNPDTDTWIRRISSNPASLYRYVLQCRANANPQPDEKIDVEFLAWWHGHCEEQGYEYNRMIDYPTTVEEILRDIASAGAASPAIVDGKYTVAVDCVKPDISGIITPRNSWGYSGEITFPNPPHAFRVRFRNRFKGYQQDERIVYDDGYNETNATRFEVLECQYITHPDLAFKTGRRHIAAIRLRPEEHTVMQDVESLSYKKGDRVLLAHDIPLIGVGDGRVASIQTDGNSPELVTGFTIDDVVQIPNNGLYYTRVRLADGGLLYKELITTPGEYNTFQFAIPFSVDEGLAVDDLCYFVESGGEVDVIITKIEPQDDLTARLSFINYAPEIFVAESAPIPAFDSKITTPLEFIRPAAPVLVQAQADESVLLKNSDGSIQTRAVFTLQNTNPGSISTDVKIRITGTPDFTSANVLEATPDRVMLTGLEEGKRYDIYIRYRRAGATMYSLPLQINNFLYNPLAGLPSDPIELKINVSGDTQTLSWPANPDVDALDTTIKYSAAFTGATYDTAQIFARGVEGTQHVGPFQPGTYFIKFRDRRFNESANAAALVTYNPGQLKNQVLTINEHPEFSGVKDNVVWDGNGITLADPDLGVGYYYFTNSADLTDFYTDIDVVADIRAGGVYVNDIFDMDDIFAETDIFGAAQNDIFTVADVFGMEDVFGIGRNGWAVTLEARQTNEDPGNSPPMYDDWKEFVAGKAGFWDMQFRLKLESFSQRISPRVNFAQVRADAVDRLERGEDLVVTDEGVTVNFSPMFKNIPAVVITIQDGASGDEIQFIDKTAGGFTFRVYNTDSLTYVNRTFDFIASGYGRKN